MHDIIRIGIMPGSWRQRWRTSDFAVLMTIPSALLRALPIRCRASDAPPLLGSLREERFNVPLLNRQLDSESAKPAR